VLDNAGAVCCRINASVRQGLGADDHPVSLSLLGGDSAGKRPVTIPIQ
jgi:hypothetical protein